MSKKTSLSLLVFPLLVVLLPVTAAAQHYHQTNLVSDVPGLADHMDPDLVNPWGLTRSATSPWWVSDNGTGFSRELISNPGLSTLSSRLRRDSRAATTFRGKSFHSSSDWVMRTSASGKTARISSWPPKRPRLQSAAA